MWRVAGRELEIIGSHGMAASDFPAILRMVAEGRLRPQDLIEKEVNLADGAAAIEAMEQGSPLGMTMVADLS